MLHKRPWFKIIGYFIVVSLLMGVGYLVGRFQVEPAPLNSISDTSTKASVKLSSEVVGLQDPGSALVWLFERFNRQDATLAVKETSRIMHSGQLSWKRIRVQGVSDNIQSLADILENSRQLLSRKFNLQLLLNADIGHGNLRFLLVDGIEVVVIAVFAANHHNDKLVEPEVDRPRVALVIDDLGRSVEVAKKFAALPLPLTFAVFPKLSTSAAVARYFVARQRDIMLHMPMEPRDYPHQDPGPGAIFMVMNADQLQKILVDDLDGLPGIIGINNHMGSRLTADRKKMVEVMDVIKGRNLFFLDSRTISGSVAYKCAVESGIPALQRDVFLDNEKDCKKIVEQFRVLVEIAKVKGEAIGIGHPYPETLKALSLVSDIAETAGIEIVPVRDFLSR